MLHNLNKIEFSKFFKYVNKKLELEEKNKRLIAQFHIFALDSYEEDLKEFKEYISKNFPTKFEFVKIEKNLTPIVYLRDLVKSENYINQFYIFYGFDEYLATLQDREEIATFWVELNFYRDLIAKYQFKLCFIFSSEFYSKFGFKCTDLERFVDRTIFVKRIIQTFTFNDFKNQFIIENKEIKNEIEYYKRLTNKKDINGKAKKKYFRKINVLEKKVEEKLIKYLINIYFTALKKFINTNLEFSKILLNSIVKYINYLTNNEYIELIYYIGKIAFLENNFKEAIKRYKQTLSLIIEIEAKLQTKAKTKYEEALELTIKIENKTLQAEILNAMAILELSQNNLSKSKELIKKSLKFSIKIESKSLKAQNYQTFGTICYKEQNYKTSFKYLTKALDIFHSIEHLLDEAKTLRELYELFTLQNKTNEAKKYLKDAILIVENIDLPHLEKEYKELLSIP